jgi:hypothetical protein
MYISTLGEIHKLHRLAVSNNLDLEEKMVIKEYKIT